MLLLLDTIHDEERLHARARQIEVSCSKGWVGGCDILITAPAAALMLKPVRAAQSSLCESGTFPSAAAVFGRCHLRVSSELKDSDVNTTST
eukprot:scaffold16325_cov119-Skeletonema_dohrnii-CCMP3373.AAC.3